MIKFNTLEEARVYFSNFRIECREMIALQEKNLDELNLVVIQDRFEDPILEANFQFANWKKGWALDRESITPDEIKDIIWKSEQAAWIGSIYSEITSPNQMIHCQIGTSMERAKQWIEYGYGVVWLEKACGCNGAGLQVNCPEIEGMRSHDGMVSYYAFRQADKTGDVPVKLEFDIQAKYLYCTNNQGEFAVPRCFWDHCENAKVTVLGRAL